MEGLTFGGAYQRGEICVSKSIGLLACSGKEIYHFCFVLLCIRGQIPSTSPPTGAYIWRGDLTEGFLHYDFEGFYLEGLIHGGAYFQNFYGSSTKWQKFTDTFMVGDKSVPPQYKCL